MTATIRISSRILNLLDKIEVKQMTDRPTKEKSDMGYNSSNMHGYSITEKGEALDKLSRWLRKPKKTGRKNRFFPSRLKKSPSGRQADGHFAFYPEGDFFELRYQSNGCKNAKFVEKLYRMK
ncbi:hypothetical protein BP422_10320 [Brevibacillus formosus]|uniref:Uncharacterized protein n=1 Tax=Brevibacillus formosus TaxID=54913 RepID=A0A220MFS7_9BACL|nr:hypothetical protein BP422_10320 [Brevibacillus formosus]